MPIITRKKFRGNERGRLRKAEKALNSILRRDQVRATEGLPQMLDLLNTGVAAGLVTVIENQLNATVQIILP